MCPLWSGSGEPCGGTTGTVEGDHALRLLARGEGLEAPLTGTVGGLVGDGEHRSQGLKVEAGSLPLEISVAGEGAGLLPPVCQFRDRQSWRRSHHGRSRDQTTGNRLGFPCYHDARGDPENPDRSGSGSVPGCTDPHRSGSTGRHSRFPSLPIR